MENVWRESLQRGLHGVWSHPDPFEVLNDVDFETAGKQVEGIKFTIWQIARHMSEWGWIMVKKVQNVQIKGPDEENNFFPTESAPPSEDAWIAIKMAWKALGEESEKLIKEFDPAETHPEFDNMSSADALMVLLTHNSHHASQIVTLRKALGVWNEKQGSGELQ